MESARWIKGKAGSARYIFSKRIISDVVLKLPVFPDTLPDPVNRRENRVWNSPARIGIDHPGPLLRQKPFNSGCQRAIFYPPFLQFTGNLFATFEDAGIWNELQKAVHV